MADITHLGADTTSGPERLHDQRDQQRVRHSAALTSLLEERTDLRGVHALADHFDDAIRWSA